MAEAEVNDEVQPNVVTQNVTSPFWSALEKSPLSLNNIQEVLSPSPIADKAGIVGKSKLEKEVKEDIEKQKQPAPVASLGSIINSDLPLNQIDNVPNNVLMNFTGQQLENARAYNQITQTNDPNNLPTLNMITDYEQLENLLKVGVKKAEKAVNPYPVGFMRDGEYVGDNRTFFGFMPNNQKSYAFNRQRLQNFALDIGLGNKPEVMNILNEHFTTGNFQAELGNRTQDLFVGGESFLSMLKIWGGDLIKSGFYGVVLNEEPDLNMFQEVFNNWNKNATNRTARYNQFLATLDNNNVMQEHTNRMNGLIKDKYIEKYGQQAYDNLVPLDKENLKLSTDQARQLYDFAFYEQNLLERTALFVVENIGVNLATGGAFKVVSSSLSNIPKLNLFPSEVAIYQTALVKQMTTRGDDGALIYSHTPISEIIRAEKLKSINKNGLMRSLGDLLTFGLSKRIRVGIAENAGEVGFLKHTKVLQNNPKIEKTYQQLNKQIANLNKLTDQGADATKINSARRLVEQTRDKLIVDSSRTISGNRFTIPSQYLKKLYGNEVVPSLAQALVYNIATDDNPESLRFAELYAAGGYMATAMGATRYAFALLGKVGGTAVPTYDDSVFAVNMILRSLRLPNILDESIIGTEFLDPVTLQKTTITAEDYKMIKYQKDKLMKLPVEVREEILTMGKASNERIAKMVALIDDKTVAKEIADDLSLGFAEMSGVLHFQALAHKLATSTALSDIVKATPTLQGALKYIDRSEKAIMAHTKVMSALRRRMVTLRQQGKITPENELKFKNLLDVNANIITGMKDHQNFLIKTVNDDFESISNLITSDIVLKATPDEFRKQLNFLKEIQKSKHIRKTKLGLKVDKDYTGTSSSSNRGVYVDFDATGITASGQTSDNYCYLGLLNSDAPTMVGTVNNYGANFQLTGGTSGTQKNVGIHVQVAGADTNYAATLVGGNVGIGTTAPEELLHLVSVDGSKPVLLIENQNDDSQEAGITFFKNPISGHSEVADSDDIGIIRFKALDKGGATHTYAYLMADSHDADAGTEDGRFLFYLTKAGTDGQEVFRMSSGEACFNEGGADIDFRVESDNNANALVVDAGNDRIGIGKAPLNTIDFGGNEGHSIVKLTATTNAASTFEDSRYVVFSNGSAVAATMPAGVEGRTYTFKNINAGQVTITRAGSDEFRVIDAGMGGTANTLVLDVAQYATVVYIAAESIWEVFRGTNA